MRRPGEVLTRTLILEHAWTWPSTGQHIVDQYIAYLRRKIDKRSAATT